MNEGNEIVKLTVFHNLKDRLSNLVFVSRVGVNNVPFCCL